MTRALSKKIGVLLGPCLFIGILLLYNPEGLSQSAIAVLATTIWMSVWWISEAVPIAVTALLPIVLFPLTGALDIETTTASFGHKYVFLFIGGFMLAIAIEKWDLHKRIALNIINLIGTSIQRIILGFMAATAFLSMWISNTATAVMMLPIATAIVMQLKDSPETKENETNTFGKALMLSIGYSSSIGGIATIIGTPPNLVLSGILAEVYGIELSFFKWMLFGVPTALVLLVICWRYLTHHAFIFRQKEFPGGQAEISRLMSQMGTISFEERTVLIVFISAALCWMLRSYLIQPFFPNIDDSIIAVFFAVLLFVLPAKEGKSSTILQWHEAVKLPPAPASL